MKINKILFIFITLIMILSLNIQSFASTINSVTRLNLSRGKIGGEKIDYIIYLPSFWSAYLTADREKVKSADEVIEKIIFYYVPQDKKMKPVFLMNFLVFDKRRWSETTSMRKVIETEDYIFAVEPALKYTFNNETDQALYNRLIEETVDMDYIGSFIKLPSDQKAISRNTVTVNKRLLSGKIFCKNNSTVYVPLRGVCEELGYKIGWLPDSKAISIVKGDFYQLVLTSPSAEDHGYVGVIVDERTYVPSIFFIQALNANVEIDENYNVSITN